MTSEETTLKEDKPDSQLALSRMKDEIEAIAHQKAELIIDEAKEQAKEIVAYRCIEEEDWVPDVDDIRNKLTDKTKIVVVINPNNPTGVVYRESVLTRLRDVVGESNAKVLSDEIYDKLVIDVDLNRNPFVLILL